MEAFTPFLNAFGSTLAAVLKPAASPVVASPVVASPLPVAIGGGGAVSLGLKVLLEPTAGGVIFRAACNTAASLYPVYASAKAIESKETRDDIQWLTYWTIFGSLMMAEYAADQALSKVPFYYHVKFAALLWLQLPQTQGAAYLYQRFYKPALVKYGPKVDAVLAKGQQALAYLYNTYKIPIDAALALLVELRKQGTQFVSYLLSEDKGAAKPKAG